jgi:hypothetical protein
MNATGNWPTWAVIAAHFTTGSSRSTPRIFLCEVTLLLDAPQLSTQPGQLGALVGGERTLASALVVDGSLVHQ